MIADLARNWWLVAIRGVVGLLFGIGAFLWPQLTLQLLILLFGSYAFVDGIFAVAAGMSARGRQDSWWLVVLEGIASIFIGVWTFLQPGSTALALLYVLAGWSIITGVFEIAAAFRLRKLIANELWLLLAGALSVVFGILLVLFPAAGAVSLIWLIGSYALVFGVLTLMLAFRLRNMRTISGSAVSAV